ncbi:MAG: general stress protein [Paenisporosarcina sp.]
MNFETNRRIEVARTEEELYNKLEDLTTKGYKESDIHVISKDHGHIHTLNKHSEVSTHEAGTVKDKLKSWFTGEDAITEGLRKLDLTEDEKNRYSHDIASGGFVLYTDHVVSDSNDHQNEFEEGYDTFGATGNSYESYHGEERSVQTNEPGFEERMQSEDPQMSATSGTKFVESRFNETERDETVTEEVLETTTFGAEEPRGTYKFESNNEEPQSEYAKEQGFTPSNNELVNETDGRFDEPMDRFERGETFATSPYLAKETDHFGHSMQEDRMVRENRPTINEANERADFTTNEPITDNHKTEGFQSPGSDPNLGPAAFSRVENEMPSGDMKHDFEKDPRINSEKFETGYESDGHGNAFAFDTDSTENEILSGGIDDDEQELKNDQFKEKIDKDQYRADHNPPPTTKLF